MILDQTAFATSPLRLHFLGCFPTRRSQIEICSQVLADITQQLCKVLRSGLLAWQERVFGTQEYHVPFRYVLTEYRDWPANCRELPPCTIAHPVDVAQRDAIFLRRVEKCDFVVGITHMRVAEDIQVTEELFSGEKSIDLILGGHDHHVLRRYQGESTKLCLDPALIDCSMYNDVARISDMTADQDTRGPVRIVKSGTDWNGLSCLNLKVSRAMNGTAYLTDITVKQFHDIQDLPMDSEIVSHNRLLVDECLKGVDERMMKLGSLPLVIPRWPWRALPWLFDRGNRIFATCLQT